MGQIDSSSLWVPCPICNSKTRTKVYEDSVLINFPLFCPKCKKNTRQYCKTENDRKQMSQTAVAEPAFLFIKGCRLFSFY